MSSSASPLPESLFLAPGMSPTLGACLRSAAVSAQGAFTYVDSELTEHQLSPQSWLEQASRVSGGLKAHGVSPGTPVLLQIEHGVRFVQALWGSILAGAVPAPLSLPESFAPGSAGIERLVGVSKILGQGAVLVTDRESLPGLSVVAERTQALPRLLVVEDLVSAEVAEDHPARPDDLALLMFSSGSTGAPKGVELTHANLVANISQLIRLSSLSDQDRSATWLPYTHDMGLVLFHLAHAVSGVPQWKVGSTTFLRDPLAFLRLLERHRITLTGQPNFAFDHLLRKVPTEELAGLDLSSLRIVYNGAEPISPGLCREFLSAMEPTGMRADVILPGFGIAEACVCASGYPFEREGRGQVVCPSLSVDRDALAGGLVQPSQEPDALELACLGPVLDGMTVRVEGANGEALPEGRVGRLLIKGPNVARSYFGRPQDPAFRADGFMDTGDLGFEWDGDIYISGRAKEVIFVHGQNFYSQDLEALAQDATCLASGEVAVVATRTDDLRAERVGLFVRMARPTPAQMEALARAQSQVARRLSYRVDAVVPLPALPRTSSGKIRRRQLADELAAGVHDDTIRRTRAELQALRVVIPPGDDLEAALLEACKRAGASGPLSVEASLIELMGDSLKLVELLLEIQRSAAHPGCSQLSMTELLTAGHVRGLAQELRLGRPCRDEPELQSLPGDVFPVSRGQQDLLFWEAFDGAAGRYNEAYACCVDVDEGRLRDAVARVVARNSALRTVFRREPQGWVQKVLDTVSLDWNTVGSDADADETLRHLAMMPFDLAEGPLHRFAYCSGGRALLVFHHLILDGLGMAAFLRQVDGVLQGEKLEPESIRPAEVHAWIQARDNDLAAARSHFARVIRQEPAPRLGSDGDGPRGTRLHISEVPINEVEVWEDASRALGLTPFQGSLLAFLLLLAERTLDSQPITGVTVPGRSHPLTRDLVGYLSNTLAVRLDLADCETLGEAAAELKTQGTALLRFQDFALSELLPDQNVAVQGVPRAPYSCAFSFMPSPTDAAQGLKVKGIERLRGPAKLDLLLSVETSAEGWTIILEGDGQRLSDADLQGWCDAFRRRMDLLVEGAALPLRLWRLRALGREMPAVFAASPRRSPSFQRVTDAFEAAAEADEDRTALTDDQGSLTYGELRRSMDSLAAFLRTQGIIPGQRVLICTDKGRAMVQAVLGVVKAGGAYVPCDADLPEARVQRLLELADPVAILCDGPAADRLESHVPADVLRLCLDARDGWTECPLTGTQKLEPLARPEDPIYLHFTSGSTGEPKGILNRHSSVCHLVDYFMQEGLYAKDDGIPQLVSFGFEAFAGELFPTLAVGATFHCLPPLRQTAPVDLARLMYERQITVATVSPSFALQLARGIREAAVPVPIRRLLFGGEPLLPAHVAAVREVLPAAELINLYGPTEATVHSTAWKVPASFDAVRIGTPLPGKRVVLIDAAGFVVDAGEPGEIWIGGAGLAIGYWRDEERTRAAFVSSELKVGRADRYYRTGDLAVVEADGALRFLGREDFQVKIHGHRVELEEIERALVALPQVRQACVVAVAEPARLVALCVVETTCAAEESRPEALRAALLESLPAYMVPSSFRLLPALPTTDNAKVDRKALERFALEPEPAAGAPTAHSHEGHPLHQAWRDVLGRDPESEESSFFLVGGDSIQAMELCAALSAQGFEISPKDVYDHPTFGALAAHLGGTQAPADPAAQEAPAVTGSVALTPIQHWFFEQDLKRPDHWLQSRAFRLTGPVDIEALRAALLRAVNHHDQLRAVVQVGRRVISQRIKQPWDEAPLVVYDLAEGDAAGREDAMQSLASSIRLSERLFAAALLRGEHEHELVLVAHHLVVDHVSWSILAVDLKAAYAALCEGQTPAFPSRGQSFQSWADGLQELADAPEVCRQLEYWKAQLPASDDAPEPAALSSYLSLECRLSSELTGSLLAKLGKARPQDLVLSLLGRALRRVVGEDIVVELESHGRSAEHRSAEGGLEGRIARTVGWFTALYPLRLPWDEDPVESLAAVWRAQREVAARSSSYGLLRYLSDDPDVREALDEAPHAWINVNFLGQVQARDTDDWAPLSSSVPLFDTDDPPPFAVIVQALVEDGELRLEIGLHPELATRWGRETLLEGIQSEARELDEALESSSPLSFDLVELGSADVGELPAGALDVYRMTAMQEAMLFHTLQHPDSAMYHEQTLYRCATCLDRGLLEKALALTQARHDMLRTVFKVVGGRLPVQIVLDRDPVALAESDLAGIDPEPELRRYLEEDRGQGRFDPGVWPLFRMRLFQTGDASYIAFSFHHILLDGWSQSALMAELMMHYRDLEQGRTLDTARPVSSMRDHVGRLAQIIANDEARTFWTKAVGAAPLLQLPRDFVPPETRTMIGEKVAVMLDPAVVKDVDELAHRLGVTFNAVCLGAWSYFIGALGGSEDVVTGVVTAGRFPDLPDSLKLLGCFLNTLPVRLSFEPESITLEQLARATQDFLNDSRPYDAYPLKEIVRRVQEMQPDRRSRDLFLQLYAFENYPTEASEQEGLELVDGYDMTNYDLTAVLVKRGSTLRVMFEYAPDVVSRETAERWLETYVSMLSGMTRASQTPAAELDLRPDNQKALLEEYNDTARPYNLDQTLHELVEAQAARTPGAVAVVDRNGSLTFLELETDANRLARGIQAAGVEAETLVAVLMPRCREAVVAFLAVMKAGGTYVPIDPTYPVERIRGIIDDAEIAHAVTCRSMLEAQPDLEARLLQVPHLFLTDTADVEAVDRADWSAHEPTPPPCPATPRNLAYIIFTSGSTGKPKGVMITHRSAVNTLLSINEHFCLGPQDAVLGFSSYSFDLSVYDMFGTLACGARLVVATEEDIQDSDRLFAWMEETGVTLWDSVPTGMAQLVQTLLLQPHPPCSSTLRFVMLSGEFIPLTLPDQIRTVFPNAQVWGFGGATEGTVWSIHYPIGAVDPAWKSIPYGRPLPNQGYYCLTDGLRPCVVNQVGMLYITGEGVAAGYYNDPEKTAAAFIDDPLQPGRIIYRTGDIGRFRGDNNLEILGRKDMQVKVRGYRIELGEVENHLGKAPGIGEAAVIALKEGEHSRLVAFYTRQDPELTAESLTAFLESRLPDYMVPSRFQALDAMPINTSGKIDRKRLPGMLQRTVEGPAGGELQGELEHRIAAAWSELLHLEDIGPEHNFFMLGGDSIMSLQVASVLAAENITIRPGDLMRHPTVRDLARYVHMEGAGSLSVADESGPTVAGPAQRWFFERLHLENPDQWFLSMEVLLPSGLDSTRIQEAINTLVQRHEALRWTWSPADQAFSREESGSLVLEERHADEASFDAARSELGQTLRDAIHLEPGRLLVSAGLLRGPDQDRLLWVIHHLVVDGFSWRVLLEELATLVVHPETELPPVGATYGQWTKQVQQAWLEPLEIAPFRAIHSSTWPEIFPGADVGSEGSAERARGALGRDDTKELLSGVHRALRTRPQDLMLGAVARALRELTDQPRLLLEMEHHGRSLASEGLDLTRTVGWFTTFYPVSLELLDDDPLDAVIQAKDALQLIRERAPEYFPWSLEQAVSYPRPQVLFNYLGDLDSVRLAPGWGLVTDGLPDRASENRRSHPVEVQAWVRDGCLQWEVAASGHGLAEKLAQLLGPQLRSVVSACGLAASRRTRGDFPMLAPDEHLLAKLQGVVDAFPPSAMQLGMFLAMKAYPSTSMYHVWGVATLKMSLDLVLLEEALNRAIQMAEIMRTVVLEDAQGRPALAVVDVHRVHIEVVDGLEPDAFFRDIDPAALDISRWPNFQFSLSRIAPDTYHFLQFFQHYLLDGWSNAIFFSNIMKEYERLLEADREGRPLPPAPPQVVRYKDFVAYQQRAARDRQCLEFWREELRGATALALPTDVPERSRRSFRTVITEFLIDHDLLSLARAHARKLGCTLSDILLGGLALLSHRLTGATDFTLGYCTSLRPGEIPGIQQAVGMFLNTLPLRLGWQDGLPVSEQFEKWRERLARCRSHEEMPLTRLSEAVRDTCDIFRQGGLKILYTSEVYPAAHLPQDAVGIDVYNWHMTEFDLALVYSSDTPRGVTVKLAYADDLWSAETISGWFSLFQDCLLKLVRPDAEAAPEWLDTSAETVVPFSELWQRRLESEPDGLAVIGQDAGETEPVGMTARQLDREARSVAAGWIADPDAPLLLDLAGARSFGVALVACLCGGQPFLVLNGEAEPESRQADATAWGGPSPRVLTDRPEEWPAGIKAQDIRAAATSEPLSEWPAARPEGWAYLPRTSGTTGEPRASVVTHRALASFLSWYVPLLKLKRGDVLSHGLARSFDAALSEWLPALAGGGAVTPLPPLRRLSAGELDKELQQRQVAVVTLPAAYFELWSALDEPPPACVRQVLVGGAPLRRSALAAWRRRCEGCEREISLWNVYGPAEATMVISACDVTDLPESSELLAPVGMLSDSLRVLDSLGHPVLPGQPGEVWLNGPQLMAGRWTAGGGFEPRPGGPWATGDQAVVDEDGKVTVLGRIGDRVKLRGSWLHLRAAEAMLSRELGLTQAVLAVDASIEPRLRVVAVDPRQRSPRELRTAIAALLPSGVHPLVQTLPSVPLTSSGKPDMARLDAPGAEPQTEPPSSVWELLVMVLDGEIPAPEEGFFANGGDSLRALQLQSLLHQRLGVSIDLERIVSGESLLELAEELGEQPPTNHVEEC